MCNSGQSRGRDFYMNQNTLFYRQIPKRYIKQDGHVSSLAFRPMPKDEHMLSVYDGDKITPQNAFLHFIEKLKGSSVGVLAVSGAECTAECLSFHADYGTHPYHVLIDFADKSNNACRKISEHLRHVALERGWLFKQ